MENSWSRLVEAAGLTEAEKRGEKIVGRLVEQMREHMSGTTPVETITNWRVRQKVSVDGALAAQRVYRCDANWVLSGDGARRLEWPMAADLWEPVARLKPEALTTLDGIVRGYLSALPGGLQNEPDRVTQQQTAGRKTATKIGTDRKNSVVLPDQIPGVKNAGRKSVKVQKQGSGRNPKRAS